MTRTRHALVAVALGGLALAGCTPSGQNPAESTDDTSGQDDGEAAPGGGPEVTTKLLSFMPDKLTVKAGTTVVWKVSDGIGHTVTTGKFSLDGDGLRSEEEPDGVLDMPLAKDKTVSHTFDKAGTYTYFCSIHKGMNGEVTVTP